MPEAYPHILRKAEIKAKEFSFSHPWNPKAEIIGTMMGRLGGLNRTGVSLVRLPPGKESFAYHMHHREEEWIFLISGSAVTTIDGQQYVLDEGDFVAFPTPSVAHIMSNRTDQDLIYLMGGENLPDEVADFPLLDRRMVKLNNEISIYKLSDGEPFLEGGA